MTGKTIKKADIINHLHNTLGFNKTECKEIIEHFFKEIVNIQDKNSKKFETKLVIVASSGKKSTSELEHNPTLIKIKEECYRNSILLICIGKGDGPAQILRQLNSIKN